MSIERLALGGIKIENKVNLVEHLMDVRNVFAEDFKEIPSFELIIENWKRWIEKADANKKQPMVSNFRGKAAEETYSHVIVFPNGKEFEFEWDIVRALEWFQKRRIHKVELPIQPLLSFMEKNEIPFDDPNQKTPQHPVIVIKTCLMGQELIVLNGNHRIKESEIQGINTVVGHFLQNDRHREWMLSDEMRLYYEFLMDFHQLEKALEDINNNQPFDDGLFYKKLQIAKRIKGIGRG